ncbi:MAG: thioredoxin [Aureispira sp.]|nr:thioredoxin [Aureispira sp.]
MFWKKNKTPKPKAVEITDQNFEEMVSNTDQPILLDFWAAWCGPCKAVGPIIDELSGEFEGRAIVGKINVDQNPNLSSYFQVKSIPTLMFIKNRQLIDRYAGLVPKPNLVEMLENLIELEVPDPPAPEDVAKDEEE